MPIIGKTTSFLFILSLITLCHSQVIAITSPSQQSNLSISDISTLASLTSQANFSTSENSTALFDSNSLEQLSKTINDILAGLNNTSISQSKVSILTTTADTTAANSSASLTPSAVDNSSTSSTGKSTQLITQDLNEPNNGTSQNLVQTAQNNSDIAAFSDWNLSISELNLTNTQPSLIPATKSADSKTNDTTEATVSNASNASNTSWANPPPIDQQQNSTINSNTTLTNSTKPSGMCNTDQDCALAYGLYVAAGLILTCNSYGVCDIS